LVGAAAGTALLLFFIGLIELTGPRPPAGRQATVTPLSEADGAIHLAGTGSWLPLARALARAYETTHPDLPAVVDSIGSGGGRRAISAGVIDVSLVSGPETEHRQLDCCEVIPIAIGAVVFVTHPSVKITGLDRRQVVRIFSGQMTTWPDGQAVVPLLREQGDSATEVAVRFFSDLGPAMNHARQRGRWPTLLTDAEMARALEATPGAVGLHDSGALRLAHPSLKVLALDGVTPEVESLADGRYPLRRVFSLVVNHHPSAQVAELVDFIRSPAGQEVIAASGGYLSLLPAEL